MSNYSIFTFLHKAVMRTAFLAAMLLVPVFAIRSLGERFPASWESSLEVFSGFMTGCAILVMLALLAMIIVTSVHLCWVGLLMFRQSRMQKATAKRAAEAEATGQDPAGQDPALTPPSVEKVEPN